MFVRHSKHINQQEYFTLLSILRPTKSVVEVAVAWWHARLVAYENVVDVGEEPGGRVARRHVLLEHYCVGLTGHEVAERHLHATPTLALVRERMRRPYGKLECGHVKTIDALVMHRFGVQVEVSLGLLLVVDVKLHALVRVGRHCVRHQVSLLSLKTHCHTKLKNRKKEI